MPFIHPLIFWTGLAAASIPIIIHILNRRRFKIREWAAMKFLLESIQKNRRRVQIEELILLAIRTLVVVLLALAIGRFTGCGQSGIVPGGERGSTSMVFVLDDSCSMGQKIGSGSLFAGATSDLIEQIKKVPTTDKIGIVLTSRPDAANAFLNMDFAEQKKTEVTVSRLQGLKPSDARTSAIDGLVAAESMLSGDVAARNKQIVLVSDFRKVDFTRDHNEALRKKLKELKDGGIKLVVMDYGRDGKNNLTIESLDLVDKFAVAKQAFTLRLAVRNNGATQVRDVEVKVRTRFPGGGEELKEVALPLQTIKSIDPGELKNLEVSVKVPQAGPAVVTAELPPDDLPGDNAATLAIDARESVRVLIVDGAYDPAKPQECESYCLVGALDPKGDNSYGNKVDVIPPEGMGNIHLDDYDLVVLADVPSVPTSVDENGVVTHSLLEALETYVMNGGGLAIFTGEKINPNYYGPTEPGGNGRFFNNGQGLLPAPLLVASTDNTVDFFRLAPDSIAADALLEMFVAMKREGQDPTMLVRFYSFNPAVEMTAAATTQPIKPPRVLARFNDPKSSPAIIAREYGKGTVVLFCSTASTRWNDWPQDEVGSYAVTMNDMAMYLARRQRAELTAHVGDPIVYEVPTRLREARITLKTPLYPAEDKLSLSGTVQDGRTLVRYDKQRTSGVYQLNLEMPDKSAKDVLLAQNVDPLEGQLMPGHKTEIGTAFGNEKDFVYVNRWDSTTSGPSAAAAEKEYWMWALAAMLLLMAAETFLGQKFGHYA